MSIPKPDEFKSYIDKVDFEIIQSNRIKLNNMFNTNMSYISSNDKNNVKNQYDNIIADINNLDFAEKETFIHQLMDNTNNNISELIIRIRNIIQTTITLNDSINWCIQYLSINQKVLLSFFSISQMYTKDFNDKLKMLISYRNYIIENIDILYTTLCYIFIDFVNTKYSQDTINTTITNPIRTIFQRVLNENQQYDTIIKEDIKQYLLSIFYNLDKIPPREDDGVSTISDTLKEQINKIKQRYVTPSLIKSIKDVVIGINNLKKVIHIFIKDIDYIIYRIRYCYIRKDEELYKNICNKNIMSKLKTNRMLVLKTDLSNKYIYIYSAINDNPNKSKLLSEKVENYNKKCNTKYKTLCENAIDELERLVTQLMIQMNMFIYNKPDNTWQVFNNIKSTFDKIQQSFANLNSDIRSFCHDYTKNPVVINDDVKSEVLKCEPQITRLKKINDSLYYIQQQIDKIEKSQTGKGLQKHQSKKNKTKRSKYPRKPNNKSKKNRPSNTLRNKVYIKNS
jgi:hypothetical protein